MNESITEASSLVQNVLMASPNSVVVLQPIFSVGGAQLDLFLTDANATARQDLELPLSEILGQSLRTFFPHLAGRDSLNTYWQVIGTRKPAQFRTQGIRLGQSLPGWFEVSAVPLKHNLLITFNEITSLEPEISPEPWTSVLQQAFEQSVCGLLVFEALSDSAGQLIDFRLVRINKAGLKMWGRKRREVVGKSVWELYPTTQINELFDTYDRVWKTGELYQTEQYYPEHDSWRDVKIVRVDRGVLVTCNDITTLKKREEKAVMQALWVDHILETIPLAMLMLSPVCVSSPGAPADYRLMQANERAGKILGLPLASVVGQLTSHVFSGANASLLLAGCRAALARAEVQIVELTLKEQGCEQHYTVSLTARADTLIAVFSPSFRRAYSDAIN